MKLLAALLMVLVAWPALAQSGPGRTRGGPGHQPGPTMQREFQRPMPQFQRPMPPPERRMGWDERQRLREEVRGGQMSRDEARQRWQEERARREFGPARSPEERQRLRRDVMEANRDLERR